MSPRKTFEAELQELQNNVQELGTSALEAYTKLFGAVSSKNDTSMQEVLKNDRNINGLQRKIEGGCLTLITKQQPIARDLRQVSAALKVVTDISRIGAHCTDIAELVIRMHMPDFEEFSEHFQQMISETQRQVADAVSAYTGRDEQSASQVIIKDDIIDNLFNLVKSDLIEHLKQESRSADDCIDMLMIAKYLEKIGDHAVNISEWAIFQETGAIDNIKLYKNVPAIFA